MERTALSALERGAAEALLLLGAQGATPAAVSECGRGAHIYLLRLLDAAAAFASQCNRSEGNARDIMAALRKTGCSIADLASALEAPRHIQVDDADHAAPSQPCVPFFSPFCKRPKQLPHAPASRFGTLPPEHLCRATPQDPPPTREYTEFRRLLGERQVAGQDLLVRFESRVRGTIQMNGANLTFLRHTKSPSYLSLHNTK